MVGAAGGRLRCLVGIPRLRHLGCLSERPLRIRSLPLAVLFAAAARRLAACLVRSAAGRVAVVRAVLAGAPDPSVSRALPRHLLLLSRRVLQGVLGRPAGVQRRRTEEQLPRRTALSAHSAERAPLP